MLPILPFLFGGAIGTSVGFALKKYYDENEDEIHEKLDSSLMYIDEWIDEKLVALDKYKDSLNEDENSFSNNIEEEINLQSLFEMKKKVYHDSFVNFVNFYEKLQNADLGKLEYQEIDFNTIVFDEKIYDKKVQNNINITNDLLFKSNNLLSDILYNLSDILVKCRDYKEFSIKEKELIKEAFSLARFIQKVCSSEDITEDTVVKFSNIISTIEEEK